MNDDLISRKEVIRFIREKINLSTFMQRSVDKADKACKELCERIEKEAPPAEPERKQGEWLEKNIVRMDDELDDSNVIDEWQSARCSKCGRYHTTPFKYSFEHYEFCPHCGKPMKE